MAEALERMADLMERSGRDLGTDARKQLSEIRFESKRLQRSSSMAFGQAGWVKSALAAALDACITICDIERDEAWLTTAREAVKEIHEKVAPVFQRAALQDALRTVTDVLRVDFGGNARSARSGHHDDGIGAMHPSGRTNSARRAESEPG